MIQFNNIRYADGVGELLAEVKEKAEAILNLEKYDKEKPVLLSQNLINRATLTAGLSINEKRRPTLINEIKINQGGSHIHTTAFTKNNLIAVFSALLKIRYHNTGLDLEDPTTIRKVVNYEMIQGSRLLLKEDTLREWLISNVSTSRGGTYGSIPELNLRIGSYEDDIDAELDLNSSSVTNTQILIAGTTGSGKSNLLAVLINELRTISVDTSYPVNFLLFDYKGEFSDPANRDWLRNFEVDASVILNPIEAPLPFNPFKDLTGQTQNEVNLYSSELATALKAISSGVQISANMNNRLSNAIIDAYRKTEGRPINFQLIADHYRLLKPENERDKMDSIQSVLDQLNKGNLFSGTDDVDPIKQSFIVKMDRYPKEGVMAKAIVYFIISKLNVLYEKLPKQANNGQFVEIRHFTIIDEAHYMLDFDNAPLRNLIAVGRNKGLSIILATQNMESYKSSHFDFYANAQYPLIMKQQTINDSVIRDLFGASKQDLTEIRAAISGLEKGELILRSNQQDAFGMGKKFKKLKVRRLI
jgi:hypothetical protein